MGVYAATHVVPVGGLDARATPDPTAAVATRLDPGLDVQVLEYRNDWARVACSNGWETWVDGRRLVTPAVAPAPVPVAATGTNGGLAVAGIGVLSLIGAAAAIGGSFLDWWSEGPISISAWDIPVKFLLSGDAGDGVKAGPFLLVVALVAIPLLTRRPLPPIAIMALGAVPIIVAGMALIRGMREEPSLDPRIGMLLTLAGGVLVELDGLGIGAGVGRAGR